MFAGIVAFAEQRFTGSGNLLARIFSDLEANNGPTRQQEWALAWRTISRNPLAGDITARRAGSTFANWDTRIVHSALLYAWMKFGLLGMASLAVLPIVVGSYAWRAVRSRGGEAYVALGAVGLAPIILLYSMSADPLIEIRTMLDLALAGALGLLVWLQREDVSDLGAPDTDDAPADSGRAALGVVPLDDGQAALLETGELLSVQQIGGHHLADQVGEEGGGLPAERGPGL